MDFMCSDRNITSFYVIICDIIKSAPIKAKGYNTQEIS